MRTKTWQTDFWNFIEENRSRKFKWGEFDCALFAKRCIEIVTDRNIELDFNWHDEATAKDKILERGGLREVVCGKLGSYTNFANCSIGDIVLANLPIVGDTLCVHDGVQILAPDETGLRRIPWQFAICGWRID